MQMIPYRRQTRATRPDGTLSPYAYTTIGVEVVYTAREWYERAGDQRPKPASNRLTEFMRWMRKAGKP